jgi:FMN phosphatase YigB (HAD superfamily)
MWWNGLRRSSAGTGFLRLFKGGVFSHEVGVRKPDHRIYELLLQRAQVEAGQVLFVDDKDWALAPATRLGMKTVLFRDGEQLRQELRRLGIRLSGR